MLFKSTIIKNSDIKKMNILFILSIFIFLFSKTDWIESTEWSYILNENVGLSEINFFYHNALSSFSGINLLNIFLLKLGLNVKIINTLFYILINATSFLSIYFFCEYLNKKSSLNYVIPFLFLFIKIDNSHGYDIIYPNNFWIFGQFGMYLCLMVISFYLLSYKRLLILSSILLSFTHVVWFIGAFFFILIDLVLKNKKYIFSYFILLSICLLVFFISINIHQTIIQKIGVSNTFEQNAIFGGHNTNLKLNNIYLTLINFIDFFIREIILFILLFFLKKNESIKKITKTLIVFTSFFILIKVYEVIDNEFVILNKLEIASIYGRIIFERYLNIPVLIFYIICVLFMCKKLEENNKNLLYLFLISTLFQIFFYNEESTFQFRINSYLLIFLFLISLLNIKIFSQFPKINIRFNDSLIIYFIIIISLSFYLIYSQQKFVYAHDDNYLLENIFEHNDKKILILGTDVKNESFNPILEFGYEVIVPDQNIDFYCNGANWKEWYENVQKCFEKKTESEWLKIYNDTDIKYLLVKRNWNLQISSQLDGKTYSLYNLSKN